MSTTDTAHLVPGLRTFTDEGDPLFHNDQLDDRLKAIDQRMQDDGLDLRRREVLDGLFGLGEDEAFAPYMDEIAEVVPQVIERAHRRQAALRAAGIGPDERRAIWRRHTIEAVEANRVASDQLCERVGLPGEAGALSDDRLDDVWHAVNPALSDEVRAIYAEGVLR